MRPVQLLIDQAMSSYKINLFFSKTKFFFLLSVFFNITTKMFFNFKIFFKKPLQILYTKIFVQKKIHPLKILFNFLRRLLQKAVAVFLLSRILLCDRIIPPINETTVRSNHVTGFG